MVQMGWEWAVPPGPAAQLPGLPAAAAPAAAARASAAAVQDVQRAAVAANVVGARPLDDVPKPLTCAADDPISFCDFGRCWVDGWEVGPGRRGTPHVMSKGARGAHSGQGHWAVWTSQGRSSRAR